MSPLSWFTGWCHCTRASSPTATSQVWVPGGLSHRARRGEGCGREMGKAPARSQGKERGSKERSWCGEGSPQTLSLCPQRLERLRVQGGLGAPQGASSLALVFGDTKLCSFHSVGATSSTEHPLSLLRSCQLWELLGLSQPWRSPCFPGQCCAELCRASFRAPHGDSFPTISTRAFQMEL